MAEEKKDEVTQVVAESKAKRLAAYYEKNVPNIFVPEEIQDELHTTVFRSKLIVENQQLPVAVFVDDSIYSVIRVQVATGVIRKGNQAQVIEHLNELNRSFKVFKYFIDADGAIFLDACVPTTDAHFEPEIIHVVTHVILLHLNEKYAELMKKVWA